MTKPSLSFHEATPELVHRYFDGPPAFTFRGYVAVLDGEPVGVGGIFYADKIPVAFSQMKDVLRPRKKDLARCVRKMEGMIEAHKGPLFATVDPKEPTSPALLRRLGFRPVGVAIPGEGELVVRR
jgi:hypothetical protein